MNQGKLEVVKQEMARVNIDILGISELKWTGMGEFNSEEGSLKNVQIPPCELRSENIMPERISNRESE